MLELRALTVRYHAVLAVRNVSFTVPAGQIIGLVGPNGAGKSSILEAISGMKRPVQGQVLFLGKRIDAWPAHVVLSCGISHVPEGRLIFTRLTVAENLDVSAPRGLGRRDVLARRNQVLQRLPELSACLDNPASALSGGQQQLLAMGRGLMADPQLILLDEPTLGLSPAATARMFALIYELAAHGMAVLLVDQNVHHVLQIASEVHVLDNGEIILTGSASDLSRDARMKEAFLGVAGEAPTQGRSP